MNRSDVRVEEIIVEPRIPVRLVYNSGRPRGPLVVVLHGLGGSSESLLLPAMRMAEAGYRLALPDARLHGSRRSDEGDREFAADFPAAFGRVVEGTSDDVRAIIDALGCDDNGSNRTGLIGVSMGAWISYLTASRDRRIVAAAPLIGSPYTYWPGTDEINPATHPERMPPCALLIQHGEEDALVPIETDRQFYRDLLPLYHEFPIRLEFIAYPGAGHEVTDQMAYRAAEWMWRFHPVDETIEIARLKPLPGAQPEPPGG